MFNKQNQNVNFNELMDQLIEGEKAKLKLDSVCKFITGYVIEQRADFLEAFDKQKAEGKECYSWRYPFKPYGDYEKIADTIDYRLPDELLEQLHEDFEAAIAHNRSIQQEG